MSAGNFKPWIPISLLLLLAAVIALFFVHLTMGSADMPFGDVMSTLFGGNIENGKWELIIMEWRLPRAVTALLMGAALSVAGLLMQTLFRNPLAGPFILGINSGASLGVAILVLGGSAAGWSLTGSYWSMILAAVIGSASILLMVLVFSFKVRSVFSLLIIGMMLGSMASAFVGILQYFSTAEQLQSFTFWTFGSLGGVQSQDLPMLTIVVVFGLLAAMAISKYLNAYLLGENYARSLGISIVSARVFIILITCLLAGVATAFCGPIAFIGLAVPHLARNFYRSSNHLLLVPACILIGSSLLLICDIIAQIPGESIVLPINAVTAMLGAPVVIWIIFHNRKLKQAF